MRRQRDHGGPAREGVICRSLAEPPGALKTLDKLGMRASNTCELVLVDEVG